MRILMLGLDAAGKTSIFAVIITIIVANIAFCQYSVWGKIMYNGLQFYHNLWFLQLHCKIYEIFYCQPIITTCSRCWKYFYQQEYIAIISWVGFPDYTCNKLKIYASYHF